MYSIEQVDATARELTPTIFYSLDFSRAAQHLVEVTMRYEAVEGENSLVLPAWVPGSYRIRDFISNVGNVAVRDARGEPVPVTWTRTNRMTFRLAAAGEVVVSWVYFADERSVRHSHVSRDHAFLNPGNLLMYVPDRTSEPVGVRFEHGWDRVTTPLTMSADGTHFIAANFDVLVDSPVEIGDHDVHTFSVQGAEHEVVVTGEGNFDPSWVVDQCRTIVEEGFRFWQSVPYDRYVFFLQFLPGEYGGLEHARSQVSVFDANGMRDHAKVRRFLALITHEFFHTWNVKRIRPVELGPFDYERENHSTMLWLAEGATSYYDDLLTYRSGFYSRKEYLRVLSDQHITALLDVPGRRVMSIRDSSFLAWVKLYNQTADSHNRFPSYYLKGGVLFLLLDLYIIRESDGASTLADGMRRLYREYLDRPEKGISEEEFLEFVSDETGVDIRATFSGWLQGVDDLPFEELLSAVGLRWSEKPEKEEKVGPDVSLPQHSPLWYGIATKEESGRLVIARVSDDSPASRAGIGTGDEILAVRGRRVRTNERFRALTAGLQPGDAIDILAASEERIYSTEIRPVPRPAMHLVDDPDATERAVRLREVWLGEREKEREERSTARTAA